MNALVVWILLVHYNFFFLGLFIIFVSNFWSLEPACKKFVWPLRLKVDWSLTSVYGWRALTYLFLRSSHRLSFLRASLKCTFLRAFHSEMKVSRIVRYFRWYFFGYHRGLRELVFRCFRLCHGKLIVWIVVLVFRVILWLLSVLFHRLIALVRLSNWFYFLFRWKNKSVQTILVPF